MKKNKIKKLIKKEVNSIISYKEFQEFKKNVVIKIQSDIENLDMLIVENIGKKIELISLLAIVATCRNEDEVRKYLLNKSIDITF